MKLPPRLNVLQGLHFELELRSVGRAPQPTCTGGTRLRWKRRNRGGFDGLEVEEPNDGEEALLGVRRKVEGNVGKVLFRRVIHAMSALAIGSIDGAVLKGRSRDCEVAHGVDVDVDFVVFEEVLERFVRDGEAVGFE